MKFQKGDVVQFVPPPWENDLRIGIVLDSNDEVVKIWSPPPTDYIFMESKDIWCCYKYENYVSLIESAREQAMEVICESLQDKEPCGEFLIEECRKTKRCKECEDAYDIHRELASQGL